MSDGVEIPGRWEVASLGEPPAAVLRRAISRVESILDRLEFRAVRGGDERRLAVPINSHVVVPIRPNAAPAGNAAVPGGIANAEELRAEAIAQGERIVLRAQQLCNQMQEKAREASGT